MTRSPIAASLLLAIASPLGAVQMAPASQPDYDVVSIHIDSQGQASTRTDVDAGAYAARDVTIKDVLEQAYDIREDLISGVPRSLDSVRFDIRARIVDPGPTAERNLTDPQRRAMLLPVLTARFRLKAHL